MSFQDNRSPTIVDISSNLTGPALSSSATAHSEIS